MTGPEKRIDENTKIFELAAEIGNSCARRLGFQPSRDYTIDKATWALEETHYNAEAARALLIVTRQFG